MALGVALGMAEVQVRRGRVRGAGVKGLWL